MYSLVVALIVGFLVAQFATLLTTIYLHRTLSHRAITVSRGVAGVARVLLWMTTGIRARQWVAVHRKHHAHTDVDGDPHSPVLLGFAAVQFGNVGLYRRAAADQDMVARYARDLPADRYDRLLFDHAFLGLGIGIALLCLVFGPWIGLLAAGVHTVSYLLLNAAVNAIGHAFGRNDHDNTARNSQVLAWVTCGEGLHNNHHAAPTSARFSLSSGEIDVGWWVVKALSVPHWAKVRHAEAPMKGSERIKVGAGHD